LCLTILREILGQTVQSYLDTKDAGKDGAFTGIWKQADNGDLQGKFVFQCKFTAKRDYNLSIADLKDEIKKVKKLTEKGECDCYILLTNAGISGELDSKIKESLEAIGISQYRSFGHNWLNQQIQQNKKLRMLVPRVYGLGDLSQILDSRAYDQAKAVLESVKDELSKVVMTGAYHKAAEALNNHGFVLIIGEPAAGKTTIATLLAMGALDNWGAETIKVAEADKMVERWNVHEKQFFWIDDAFGVTQYEKPLATQWNHALAQVKAMIKTGSKIVLTSRDYIYARARKDLKESAFPLLLETKVVIDVHELTEAERKQILYNHLKLGRQTQEFKKKIKPFLEPASNLPKFVPESARRISDPAFTNNLSLTEHGISQFIEHPKEMLLDILRGLHTDQLAALALIYMRNDKLESPVSANNPELEAIERIGSTQGACLEALVDMQGSLVQLLELEAGNVWKFKHPTIGDAFADLLISNAELIGIYLLGSKIESLFYQITCGNVGLIGAIVVPESLFSLIIDRLSSYNRAANFKNESYAVFHARWNSDRFLAYRCSKKFLNQYIQRNPDLTSRLEKPELYLEHKPSVSLAITLIREGLFPPEARKKFIDTIIGYTVEGYDFFLLQNEELIGILIDEEKESLFENIKLSFIPNLEQIRRRWESERNMEDTAEEYLEPFTSTMILLREHFQGASDLQAVFSAQLTKAEQWIEEQEEPPVERKPRDRYENLQQSQNFEIKRSIFDDVDE
jgi:hypothetical protein